MSTLRLSYARGLLSLEGGCATALSAARPPLAGGAWERGDRRRRVQRRRGKIDQQTASVARVPHPRIRPGEYDLLIAIGLDAHDDRKVAVPDQGVRAERETSQHRQQSHGLDRHAEARSPVQPCIQTCHEQDRDVGKQEPAAHSTIPGLDIVVSLEPGTLGDDVRMASCRQDTAGRETQHRHDPVDPRRAPIPAP